MSCSALYQAFACNHSLYLTYRWHCILTRPQFFHTISIAPRLRFLHLFLALYVTLAHSQSLTPTLSPSLANTVPLCARHCLQSFIAESFPTSICSNQQDLACLCTHKSTGAYTLGEGAYRCIALTCTNETVRDAGAYQVCAGIQNALPNTHATITATMVAAPSAPGDLFDTGAQTTSSQLPLSIVPSSGSISATGLVTATGSPSGQPSPTNASSVVTSTLVPSQASHAAATTSSVAPVTTGALTTPQIAGIAVAGVASASVAFGIMLFLYCLRRRRALKQQMEQLPFEIEKAPPKNPDSSKPPPPPPKDGETSNDSPDTAAPNAGLAPRVPPKDSTKRRSFWRRTIKPDDIGVAVSPETAHQASPRSVASYRTTSRLLPDKPAYTLWPRPMRVLQYTRPESTSTNFEEDLYTGRRAVPSVPMPGLRGSRSIELSQRLNQGYDLQNQYYSQEYPVDSLALMFAKEKGGHHRRPSLPTNIRPQTQDAPEAQRIAPPNRLERPPALRHPTALRPGPPQPRNLQPSSIPPTARSSNYSANYSLASSEPHLNRPIQSYHPASRRSMSTRQSLRYSNASDTSFESAGEDDETPPAEPTLSPVVESPQNSPISALKYPKVPRSASIAKTAIYRPPLEVGRGGIRYASGESNEHDQSQASRKRDGSPSSLLAKRRGTKAAAELEKGLRLRQDDNVAAQNKTVLKVVNAPGIENARQGLKSPAWEPKLTPTLRGGDLYLDVQ